MQLQGTDAELTGDGTYTEQDYIVYIFTISYLFFGGSGCMEYSKVIQRFKSVFAINGAKETADSPFFHAAAPEKLVYLTDLYETFNYWTSIYLNGELEALKAYQVPVHIIDFYQNYEPNNPPLTKAGIYLCDLDGIKAENASAAPGGILIRYGLITIATTIGGMAICIDLNVLNQNDPQIVMVDLDDCLTMDCVQSYEDVQKIFHVVAPGFNEFIWKLSGDEYNDFEDTFL